MSDELSAEERAIADVIRAARQIQEFLWGQHNAVWELEEWRRMFRKRVAKLDEVEPSNPHASIEIKKRLLQTAALAVAMIGRIDSEGMPSLTPSGVPSNLPQYAATKDEQPGMSELQQKCADFANRLIRESNRKVAVEQERDELLAKVKQLTTNVQHLQSLFDADNLYKRMHSAEQERDTFRADINELRARIAELSDMTKVSAESLAEEPLSAEEVGKAELCVLSRVDCEGMAYIEASLMRRLIKTIESQRAAFKEQVREFNVVCASVRSEKNRADAAECERDRLEVRITSLQRMLNQLRYEHISLMQKTGKLQDSTAEGKKSGQPTKLKASVSKLEETIGAMLRAAGQDEFTALDRCAAVIQGRIQHLEKKLSESELERSIVRDVASCLGCKHDCKGSECLCPRYTPTAIAQSVECALKRRTHERAG